MAKFNAIKTFIENNSCSIASYEGDSPNHAKSKRRKRNSKNIWSSGRLNSKRIMAISSPSSNENFLQGTENISISEGNSGSGCGCGNSSHFDLHDLELDLDQDEGYKNKIGKTTYLTIHTIGRHRDVDDSNFDKNQLLKGIKIEKEHTDDEDLAKEIAKDHLSEIPDYYDRLEKMEQSYKKEA